MNQQLGFLSSACGDCHLVNFGAFAAPEQNILFDINDFDETLPAVDITADLKRLGASVAVAALAANLSKKRARAIAATTVEAYRTHLRSLARRSPLEIWHSRVSGAALKSPWKLLLERSLFLLCFAYNGSVEVAGGMVSHHFPLQA
jgi:Uncharacterized protein conserved in bacteria (DUF2252)